MDSQLRSARSVAEEPISRGQNWAYLNNLVDDGVAQCNSIDAKNGTHNRPNLVKLSNYGFDLPSNAEIQEIQVTYRDRMVSNESETDTKYFPLFGDTKITFLNSNINKSITGKAPSINFEEKTVSLKNPNITAEQLNSNDFTVQLEYNYNQSNRNGHIYCDYVKVNVLYEIPRYNVSINEPRHFGTDPRTWSTGDDPTILKIGEECKTNVVFRSTNSYDGGVQTVRINFPINYKLLEIIPSHGELIVYDDRTYVDWVVNPPLKNRGEVADTVRCTIVFTPRAFDSTEMVTATILSTGQSATYFVSVETEYNYSNDVKFVCPRFTRLSETWESFNVQLAIDMPKEIISRNHNQYPMVLKLWDLANDEYVPFNIRTEYGLVPFSNKKWKAWCYARNNNTTYELALDSFTNFEDYTGKIIGRLDFDVRDFTGAVGEYELRLFLPHGGDWRDSDYDNLQNFDMYYQSIYVEKEVEYFGVVSCHEWEIKSPNVASSVEDGGYAFACGTANGFQWKINMRGCKTIMEKRQRHIGGLKLAKSHYEPKLKFSNKVNKGTYKNRAYYNKTGQWEHDLSLNIYLPKFDWRTLQEFVKMDKPVSIDTCPSCSDDDVLNHRGWVEIEEISNVERVNNWWYKGEIGVQRITDKYYGRANIIKGERVCNAKIPFSMMNTVKNGDYYLGYFDLMGGGQLIYDKENSIINQIIVPTGQNLHLRSKWASKDIDDYKFNWRCVMPSEATDESNDYKYNAIVYTIIDNLTGETRLTYTLYDFTTFDEIGNVVNTCKVSCTSFDINNNPTLLFNKLVRLDYGSNPMEYWSTTRFEFDANMLTISESGLSGQEVMERNISLPSGEYLLDIAFSNNDVGLLEPDFVAYLNMDLQENILANPLSNFYGEILISPFVIPNLKLLFYRYSEDGILYYYYGDTSATYLVDGYQQYKGGVDLQTENGASILYIDNYTQTLFLNNGLCKIGFDRQFGTIMFSVYDYNTRDWARVEMLKIDDWTEFEIIAITDDKAVVQFGQTIWTMWRGHPFIQCEHINTDLIINSKYDTINSESIITKDGDIVYDGSYGKKENYLYNKLVTPVLSVHGDNAPNFISGDTITLKSYVKDKYGVYLNNTDYPNVDEIGKMEFVINDQSSYIQAVPQADSQGRWYWQYTYTPPAKNEDYQAYTRFLPRNKFTESTSSGVRYTVRKIKAYLSISSANTGSLTTGSIDITFTLKDENNNNLQNQAVIVYVDGERQRTIYTGSNGQAVYTQTLTHEGFMEVYGVYNGTDRYENNKSSTKTITIKDDRKTDVTLTSQIQVQEKGKVKLQFSGTNNPTGNINVKIDGSTYSFDITSSKIITLSKTGTYNYSAEYVGDNSHNKARLTGTFTLSKTTPTISLGSISPSTINLGNSIHLSITGSISNMTYTLYDNDSPIASGSLTNGAKAFDYSPSYAGSHQFKVKYNGDTWTNSATSETRNVTVNNSTTSIRHCNGAVYQGSKDYVKLLDANNTPIPNKEIRITINGITYTRVTDSQGYANLNINLNPAQYSVHAVFMGDNAYQTSHIDYVLTVKGSEVMWRNAHSFANAHNSRTAPYQIWNHLDGFETDQAYCTCGYSTNINEVIGTKAGTWHTPDQLALYNFQFDLPNNAKITEIRARIYERQYDPRSAGYPNIGHARIHFQDHDPRTCSQPPLKSQSGWNINEVAWSSPKVSVGQLNHSSFSMFLNHGQNMGVNTGALMLKKFEVGVVYSLETVKTE